MDKCVLAWMASYNVTTLIDVLFWFLNQFSFSFSSIPHKRNVDFNLVTEFTDFKLLNPWAKKFFWNQVNWFVIQINVKYKTNSLYRYVLNGKKLQIDVGLFYIIIVLMLRLHRLTKNIIEINTPPKSKSYLLIFFKWNFLMKVI